MNLPDVEERARLLEIGSPHLMWLQNEPIFEKLHRDLNIVQSTDRRQRDEEESQ